MSAVTICGKRAHSAFAISSAIASIRKRRSPVTIRSIS
jgi:hypothetical protein